MRGETGGQIGAAVLTTGKDCFSPLGMAVYTEVSDEDLDAFLAQYPLGGVVSCKGIAEGVENSIFLIVTERGPYILTLYEKRVDPRDLPFFLGLMDHLASRGLACPTPIHGRDGKALRSLCGRPAAMVSFLKGVSHRRISLGHCAELGPAMASTARFCATFAAGRRRSSPFSRACGRAGCSAATAGRWGRRWPPCIWPAPISP